MARKDPPSRTEALQITARQGIARQETKPGTDIGMSSVVQLVATWMRVDRFIDRRSVAGISSISLDALIASAIGTMSLAALAGNIPALLILTVIAVAWSAG